MRGSSRREQCGCWGIHSRLGGICRSRWGAFLEPKNPQEFDMENYDNDADEGGKMQAEHVYCL